MKEFLMPAAFHAKPFLLQNGKGTFHHKRVGSHLGKLCQLSFTHAYLFMV